MKQLNKLTAVIVDVEHVFGAVLASNKFGIDNLV